MSAPIAGSGARSRTGPLLAVAGVVSAAALARLIALTREPMWLDEIFTDQFTGGAFV